MLLKNEFDLKLNSVDNEPEKQVRVVIETKWIKEAVNSTGKLNSVWFV